MPVQNSDVKDIFNKLADLLDIEGANPFRVRAYRNAARTVSGLPGNISDMINEDEDLTRLPGIGKDLAGKIREIVETGTLSQLQEAEKKTPRGLNKLLRLESLGPKKVKLLYHELGISNLKELKGAAKKGNIRKLEGFGEKTEQKILESLELNAHPDRLDLSDSYCKMAREMNVRVAISTDAHSRSDFKFIGFGVDQARRGWLETKDIINTRSLKDLKKILQR